MYSKGKFILLTTTVTVASLYPVVSNAQIDMEIGGGVGQINWGGNTYYRPRYTVVFPNLVLNNKLGFYFTLESTGKLKYSTPIDNWGITYKFHKNLSAYYGHALIHMQTPKPELFPFTGRQDLGLSISPNKIPLNFKLGYAFWVGPTFQITYNILKKDGLDSDKDGIRNRFDKCSNTDSRYIGMVNEYGCPLDSDNDQVPDVDDSCRNSKGLASLYGCPDIDGDLVADKYDQCPTAPGLRELNGCPPPKNNITNSDPALKDSLIATNIIPSPSITPADEKLALLIKSSTPHFVFDDYVLMPDFKKKLIPIILHLKNNPTANILLIGHTDQVGTPEYNMTLSVKRALEVKKYLISKGINTKRITTIGKGATSPLFLDNSETARMANRRVELIIK